MKDHPVNYERLLAFASEELSPADASDVSRHLEACNACARVVSRYQAIQATVRVDAEREPSLAIVARTNAIFRPAAERKRDLSPLDRIIATLTFNSSSGLALAGVRDGAQGYQMTFESPAANVDVQLFPPADAASASWHLLGEVEETGSDRARAVRLYREREALAAADLGEDQMFDLGVQTGSYELQVELSRSVVVLPDIVVPRVRRRRI